MPPEAPLSCGPKRSVRLSEQPLRLPLLFVLRTRLFNTLATLPRFVVGLWWLLIMAAGFGMLFYAIGMFWMGSGLWFWRLLGGQ